MKLTAQTKLSLSVRKNNGCFLQHLYGNTIPVVFTRLLQNRQIICPEAAERQSTTGIFCLNNFSKLNYKKYKNFYQLHLQIKIFLLYYYVYVLHSIFRLENFILEYTGGILC